MALLTTKSLHEVRADVMSDCSSNRQEIPITKNQLGALIAVVDSQQNSSEIAIIATVPAGDARDWLITNTKVSRDIIVKTEAERRDTL